MGEGDEAVIELRGVRKAFDESIVLAGLDLEVRRGETLVIIGGSGTGKSVTLKHIVRLLEPDEGTVRVFGRDVSRLSRRRLEALRLRIGYLFQSGALINWLTVAENVALPLREHCPKLPEAEIRRRVDARLELVHLLDARDRYPAEVSGGMKKRAGLARAAIMDPEIILYDEPTSGLDPVMASSINALVREAQRVLGVTQVAVTHDMASAYAIADRIAMLHRGRITFAGTPGEVRASEDPVVRQFIRGERKGPLSEEEVSP